MENQQTHFWEQLLESSQTFHLADEILAQSGTELTINNSDFENDWSRVVLLNLLRSYQALTGVKLAMDGGLYTPAVVLCRHLFELAVTLKYLQKDPGARAPYYLKHSRRHQPSNPEEAAESQQKFQAWRKQEDYRAMGELTTPSRQ